MVGSIRFRMALFSAVAGAAAHCFSFTPLSNEAVVPAHGGMESNSLVAVLENLNDQFEAGNFSFARSLISYDFLHATTNSQYQGSILPYTRSWIAHYGEEFPEAFFLHCLAGGNIGLVVERYETLDSLISRNYARWCLMVRNEPLVEDPLEVTEGAFSFDQELWDHVPAKLIAGARFSKAYSVTRLLPVWSQIVDESVVVSRPDGVPVPWGNEMTPEIGRYPGRPTESMLRVNADSKEVRRPPVYGRHISPYVSPIGVGWGTLRANENNRIWNFFVAVHAPYLSIGGQVVSADPSVRMEGSFRYLTRILVSKRLRPPEDWTGSAEQELYLSPPINFSVRQNENLLTVDFSWDGPTIALEPKSYEELLEEARLGLPPPGYEMYRPILRRRLLKRVSYGAIFCIAAFLIPALLYRWRKIG